jgi:AcrR family transcriptional regulator
MSSAEHEPAMRPYRMRRRAENVEDTRRRIVDATVALHGSVGPSGTTFLGVAERAGVTRATVYRHFPDDDALFAACSAHWLAQNVPPNPSAWAEVGDPVDRLRAGLSDLYRFYRAGTPMLMRIHRDLDFVPERHRRGLLARDEQARDLLLAAYPAPLRSTECLRAAIGHAVSFSTWHSLCINNSLRNEEAVEMMITLAAATGTGRPFRATRGEPDVRASPAKK